MEQAELTQVWRVLGESVFEEMAQWRKEHPTATFKEIEDELDGRLGGMRAQMLADLAHQSQKREWGTMPQKPPPSCPQCGGPLQARGLHHRSLATQGGTDVKLRRSYGTCPQCGGGFFPPG